MFFTICESLTLICWFCIHVFSPIPRFYTLTGNPEFRYSFFFNSWANFAKVDVWETLYCEDDHINQKHQVQFIFEIKYFLLHIFFRINENCKYSQYSFINYLKTFLQTVCMLILFDCRQLTSKFLNFLQKFHISSKISNFFQKS